MAADALTIFVTRTSAAMMLDMYDQQVFVFHKEFVEYEHHPAMEIMIENKDVSLRLIKTISFDILIVFCILLQFVRTVTWSIPVIALSMDRSSLWRTPR